MLRFRVLAVVPLLFALALPPITAFGQGVEQLELLPPLGDPTLSAAATAETILPPVEAGAETMGEVTVDAPWWQPQSWFDSPVWDFGAELGINGSEGNAQSLSLQTAFNGKRETEGNVLEWDLKYSKSQTGGLETQHYALFISRWDWKFTPTWFLYNKNTVEYDEFKAFDIRLMASGGLGHHLIKNQRTTLTARFGAGASREFGAPVEEWIPEANFGGDFEHKISARQSVKLSTDYYPAWEDLNDYRMVTNAHWEIILDEETNLSLKLGAVDLYDSTPNGTKPNDINYFATLLWKM